MVFYSCTNPNPPSQRSFLLPFETTINDSMRWRRNRREHRQIETIEIKCKSCSLFELKPFDPSPGIRDLVEPESCSTMGTISKQIGDQLWQGRGAVRRRLSRLLLFRRRPPLDLFLSFQIVTVKTLVFKP